MQYPYIFFVIGFLFSILLLHIFMPLLSSRFLDHPNSRSSHNTPIPRGGGISFVFVSLLSSLIASFFNYHSLVLLPFLLLPLVFVGFLDDFYNITSSTRFSVQLLSAFFLLYTSPLYQILDLRFSSIYWFFLLILLLLIVVIAAIINFVNFMDGLDGLVAGCMFVLIITSFLHSSIPSFLWAFAGSLLCFFFWNWSPAKVFMGDVGSTFLGAFFAGLLLHTPNVFDAFGLLLVASPLLADACLCVPRRFFNGENVLLPHRLHLFQRLHQAGWSHGRVSTIYITGTALLGFAYITGGLFAVFPLSIILLIIGFWLDQYIAVPFLEVKRN